MRLIGRAGRPDKAALGFFPIGSSFVYNDGEDVPGENHLNRSGLGLILKASPLFYGKVLAWGGGGLLCFDALEAGSGCSLAGHPEDLLLFDWKSRNAISKIGV